MVQWWYGHNAVGFFLTAGFLGMMYYYIPKQAERPVYSYRLSIVHFWALIFTYMWAGPHHLHYTALPDWAQSVGMVFSLVLLAPSWGGMINGIMTLSGCLAQAARRPDPEVPDRLAVVLRHEHLRGADDVDQDRQRAEPLHRLDDRPRAQRRARLGRADLDGLAVLPDPALYGRKEMYSVRAIELHFWIATIGIVLYIAAMWIAGVMQGLMWRAVNPDGTLVYSFVESVKATYPVLRDPPARRPAVPERHADHGLERGHDGRRATSPAEAPRADGRGPRLSARRHHHGEQSQAQRSREDRDQQLPDDRADPGRAWRSAASSRSCRCSSSAAPRSRSRASSPTPRCSSPGATSTSARAATTATRR